jgi:hypothetical protein
MKNLPGARNTCGLGVENPCCKASGIFSVSFIFHEINCKVSDRTVILVFLHALPKHESEI